jgi:diguanylate cyclase (GGDEF)-like protein
MFHSEQREIERLAAVDRYDVLDTPREQLFDALARLVCRLLDVPMSAVSAIDGHRQWFKASEGLDNSEAPRSETICVHTLSMDTPLVIPDAKLDPRFADKSFVTGEPHVRSYAGVPLKSSDGFNIGTLCAIGREPREFGEKDIAHLTDLAIIAMEAMEYRLLANTDPLTQVLSRRAFKDQAGRAVALALRHSQPLSAIVLDLDHFKSINDTHGHAIGDAVITGTIQACAASLRGTDIVGRLGGEEFAFVLPQTERSAALEVAEKLRVAIERLPLRANGRELKVTASFGVAALDHVTRDIEELLRRADLALYEAKAAGRNQCKAALAMEAERRDPTKRRVFKGGQIIFGNRMSTVDCTVRSLSQTGAGIDVSSSAGLPKTFVLSIRGDGLEVPCRVIEWAERHIEVEFVGQFDSIQGSQRVGHR